MNYRLYQMEFLNGIHFGIQALDDTQIMLPADTLFSALCQEALRIGKLEELVFLAEQGIFSCPMVFHMLERIIFFQNQC